MNNIKMKVSNTKWLTLTLLAAFIISCAKVPLTGRKQLHLLPESDLVAMSLTQYNTFLQENDVVSTGADHQSVQRVGERIASAVESYLEGGKYEKRIAGYNWEFNLVEDPTVNAWCMPGGKVVFYSGILPICENDTGIAVVMGHEVAHAIARHGNERMSQQIAQQLGGVALNVALSEKPEETQQLFSIAYGLGTTVGVMLPFSRLHESEADHMGLMFMAMAGYDPREAPEFWERMNAKAGPSPPEFLSTHPNPERRAEHLNELMPDAMNLYNKRT